MTTPAPGVALIRDGNGTRSFETLLRYRGAAMAEFMRALRTLKALQAEPAAEQTAVAEAIEVPPKRLRAPARVASRPAPNEPDRIIQDVVPEPAVAGCALHEPVARALRRPVPNEPDWRSISEYPVPEQLGSGHSLHEPGAPWMPNEPEAEGTARL